MVFPSFVDGVVFCSTDEPGGTEQIFQESDVIFGAARLTRVGQLPILSARLGCSALLGWRSGLHTRSSEERGVKRHCKLS
jgi:hypothetical protein